MASLVKSKITIVDMTDVIVQSTAPASPAVGTRWINTGTSPYVLYVYSNRATWDRETDYDILNAFSMHDIVLEDITADGRLTPYEKSQLSKVIVPKLSEANSLKSRATDLGSSKVTELSSAISALESLYNTHVTANPSGTSNVPPSFDQDLNAAFSSLASAMATVTTDLETINKPVVISLSKDSYLIPGTTLTATATTTTIDISAHKGPDLVPVNVTAITGQVKGLTATINDQTNNSEKVTITIKTTTNLVTKAGSLVFSLLVDGKSYTREFVYAISLIGIAGSGGYTLALSNESHQFLGGTSEALIGTTTSQVIAYKGTEAIAATFGTINTPQGMTITTLNDKSVNASLKIDVDEGLTPLSGDVIIPITIDGKEMAKIFSYSVSLKGENGEPGKDAVHVVMSSPDGDVFQSVAGAVPSPLTLMCDLYVGGVIEGSGVTYQWFIQEGSANEGAGAGWKKLIKTASYGTSGYTEKTLTVPASAVPSLENFKCKATYKTVDYFGTIALRDSSDPYQVVVECLQGDSFFNSAGNDKTLTARIYQRGTEVDLNGTVFRYEWLKFIGGAKDTSFNLTTKSLTIKAQDVLKETTYICNVFEKV